MEKKAWGKPKLVVLVRRRPEEAVLAACKTAFAAAVPAGVDDGCTNDAGRECVSICSAIVTT